MFGKPKYYDDELGKEVGFGWLPPFPDSRDYDEENPKVQQILDTLPIMKAQLTPKSPVDLVNLSSKFPTVKDQGNLGSCTANAAAGIIEYYQNVAHEDYVSPSRLFIYKTTRNLLGLRGDTGAYLRTTMGALAYFGAPPEEFWAYRTRKYDTEPGAFLYGMADNYEALTYFCHDPLSKNIKPVIVLDSVKRYLAAGIPSMFGFYVFNSMNKGKNKKKTRSPGFIPFPSPGDKCVGGHAIVAVGYDDLKEVRRYKNSDVGATIGALKILNSWGTGWGEEGFGWLPYEYVLQRYAVDFWSIINMKWMTNGDFGFNVDR